MHRLFFFSSLIFVLLLNSCFQLKATPEIVTPQHINPTSSLTAASTQHVTSTPSKTNTPEPIKTSIPTTEEPIEEEPDLEIYSFNLVDQTGLTTTLDNYRDYPIMLIFFSIHCGHCQNESTHLENLYQTYKDQKLTIIAVEVSRAEINAVTSFADEYGFTFPVYSDPEQVFVRSMGVTGVPTNFLIHPGGSIFNTIIGYHTIEELEQEIQSFLDY